MAYKSGEFRIPGAALCGAAAVFNNTLFVVNTFEGEGEVQITLDLTKLKKQSSSPSGDEPIDGDALTNPANWVVKDGIPSFSTRKPALVSFAGAMYSFVNRDSSRVLHASRYSLSDDTTVPGTWSQMINILESDGSTAPTPYEGSDLSATTVGDNIIILACAHAWSSSNPAGGTYVAIYDTRDLDTSQNKWVAKWHDYLPNDLPGQGFFESNLRVHVSVEWFSAVAPNAQKTDPPVYYVAVLVQPEDIRLDTAKPVIMSYYTMTLGETAGSEVSVTLARYISNAADLSGFFANLIRDPAGRLRSWYRDNGKGDYTAVIIQTTPGEGMGFNHSQEVVTVGDNPPHMPFSLFVVFTDGQSDTTVNGHSTTQYPVYEFFFYGFRGECQVNRCGTIQQIPDFSVRKTKEDLVNALNVISGIIDGPIPIPLENFKDYNPGPGQTNAGKMIYGIENSEDSSHKVSNKWSLGFETEGTTVAGVGAAWDISFKGGTGSVVGDSSGTTTSYDLRVNALISTAKDNNDPSIVPDGVLRGVGVQFSITAFRYLDNFGPNVDSTDNSATNGIKAAMVTTSMVDENVLNFTPYMVTPGKLESYTPEAINSTMNVRYPHITNYFGDVIMTNAYPFTDPKNPYLGYSWSKDGASGQSFSEWAESFQETSWHLDLHAYGGISGSTGENIFGMGEDLEWSIMAGIDYSHDSITDTDKKSGWSIGLGDGWGPPFRDDLRKSVLAYDFRVYLLPVPTDPSTLTKTYWTTELLAQTKLAGIDGNSGCWRIVYVVTKIEHLDGSNPYQYNGKLDVPQSVYKVGR